MSEKFFLFLGHGDADSAVSKLKASGISFRKKMLESKIDNWRSILDIISTHEAVVVIAKLSGRAVTLIGSPAYAEVSNALLDKIASTNHVFFLHESVMTGEQEEEGNDLGEDDDILHGNYMNESYIGYILRTYRSPTTEERTRALDLLRSKGINTIPYRTNAELSVMAGSFVDDNERNLLFRVYVPSGQLYAAEADKLINLFREWLGRIGRHKVRQDGYATSAGRVYEFFGDDKDTSTSLSQEFSDFSDFLDLCVESPDSAADRLMSLGLDRVASAGVVAKYSREVRRLQVDLRHEREMRLLQIRQSAETEIFALNESAAAAEMISWVEQYSHAYIPPVNGLRGAAQLFPTSGLNLAQPTQVVINNQIFPEIKDSIVNLVQGTANYGTEARQILELIREHGSNSSELQSAVHEVEDPDAREIDRLTSRQRLKNFLNAIKDEGQKAVIGTLQKYLESKIGL